MAISVNPSTYVITIPQADLTLIGGSTYQLDTNELRIWLRDWEDNEEGIYQPKTHTHNTQVTLGGIQYARVIEILSPYTITFEEKPSPYIVTLIGSNNNVLEKTNLGTVQILSNNSAGLINVTEIQRAAFAEAVWYDQVNGVAGTNYPTGTPSRPVSNLADAKTIGTAYGFSTLNVLGDLDAGTGDSLTGWILVGKSTDNHVHLDPGSTFTACTYYDMHLHGEVFGESRWVRCHLMGITGMDGMVEQCMLGMNDKVIAAGGTVHFVECSSAIAGVMTASIDCNGNGTLVMREYSGGITVKNKTSGDASIDLASGSIVVDATCTGGTLVARGTGRLTNNGMGISVLSEGLTGEDFRTTRAVIEMLRPTHQGFGKVFFVDPVNGFDTNDGLSAKSPLKTFAAAHALCTSGANDVIQFINPSSVSTTVAEDMVITKNNVHFRATSRDITFKPATSGGAVLTIGDGTGTNGYSCSVTGPLIDGDKAGTFKANHCIEVNGKFCALNYVWAKQSVLSCIKYNGGDYHTILDGEIEKSDTHGVETVDLDLPSGSPREISIFGRTNIYLNGGDGIHLGADVGEKGATTRIIRILSAEISLNGGYGIHADADVDQLAIGTDVMLYSNNGGTSNPQINILTTTVYNDLVERPQQIAEATWDRQLTDILAAGSVGEYVKKKVLTVGKFLGLK